MLIFIIQTLLLLLGIFFLGYLLGRLLKNALCRNNMKRVMAVNEHQTEASYSRTADRLAARHLD